MEKDSLIFLETQQLICKAKAKKNHDKKVLPNEISNDTELQDYPSNLQYTCFESFLHPEGDLDEKLRKIINHLRKIIKKENGEEECPKAEFIEKVN